jgi:hypothetical protein
MSKEGGKGDENLHSSTVSMPSSVILNNNKFNLILSSKEILEWIRDGMLCDVQLTTSIIPVYEMRPQGRRWSS